MGGRKRRNIIKRKVLSFKKWTIAKKKFYSLLLNCLDYLYWGAKEKKWCHIPGHVAVSLLASGFCVFSPNGDRFPEFFHCITSCPVTNSNNAVKCEMQTSSKHSPDFLVPFCVMHSKERACWSRAIFSIAAATPPLFSVSGGKLVSDVGAEVKIITSLLICILLPQRKVTCPAFFWKAYISKPFPFHSFSNPEYLKWNFQIWQ